MPKMTVMKKFLLYCLFCLCILFSAVAQSSDSNSDSNELRQLAGIWENPSRFVVVNQDNTLFFVLKTFYGYYYDQTAVLPAGITSGENGETILRITYLSSKIAQPHPIGVINDKLFLDFHCKGSAFAEKSENSVKYSQAHASSLYGYWRACGNVSGIEVALPVNKTELICYYFTDKDVYLLRYWLADVPYEKVQAQAVDGDFSFAVDKFLTVGDCVYTCITGRGIKIRNLARISYELKENTIVFNGNVSETEPFYMSADGTLLSFSEPYLKRSTVTDMQATIAEHNLLTHNPLKNPMEVFKRETAWEKKLKKL